MMWNDSNCSTWTIDAGINGCSLQARYDSTHSLLVTCLTGVKERLLVLRCVARKRNASLNHLCSLNNPYFLAPQPTPQLYLYLYP